MIIYKTSTSGNDFIIVSRSDLEGSVENIPEFAKKICNAKTGEAADGIVIFSSDNDIIDFSIFNSDGSKAEISGNGMAGLSSVLFSLNNSLKDLYLRTKAGVRYIQYKGYDKDKFLLEVDMGLPDFNKEKFFPFLIPGKKDYEYRGTHFFPVSTGNPHAVVLLQNNDTNISKLKTTGMELESAPIFPEKTNVEFVFPIDSVNNNDTPVIKTFFYERGAGVTSFSSTGSTAVFAVLHDLGIIGNSIKIETSSEPVLIYLKDRIFIESRTKIVYKREYNGKT